ncbi:MAG: LmbE family N-acetylglucosaminyl deacetylase [Saprospiraceae bacterium]|jgi:LmbE family N-acetylglucosaminyl deacetylase
MILSQFQLNEERGLNILAVGAHCDDIEIGCGGTLLKIFDQYKINHIKWLVFASTEERKQEAINSAAAFLKDVPDKEIIVLNYRDAFLEASKYEIKEYFESIKKDFTPDLVFTHYRNDRHQDHRLLSDLAWNTFRSHLILEYEIPKYDGDLGIPNCFFHISPEQADKKVNILIDSFNSQKGKHWFDKETFLSLMRIRGMEAAATGRYAEAFHLRKLIM